MLRSLSLYIILSIISFANLSYAQDISALETEAQSALNWEKKLNLYLEMADTLIWVGEDLEKAEKYAGYALEICETEDCGELVWLAHGHLAQIEINRGDFKRTEDVILIKLKENNLKSKEIEAYLGVVAGGYYVIQGITAESIDILTKSEEILKSINPSSKRLGEIYYYLAFAHNLNGENDLPISLMNESINQYKLIGDSLKLVESISGLSTIYSVNEKYPEGIKLVLEAIDILDRIDEGSPDKYALYDGLMDMHIRVGNYEKARKGLEKVIPEFRVLEAKEEFKIGTSWSLNMSMAKVLGKLDKPEEGLIYIDSAYVYAQNLGAFTMRITDLRQAALTLESGSYELATGKLENLLEAMKEFGSVDAFNAVLVGLFADLYMKSGIPPNEKIWSELQLIIDRVKEKNKGQYNDDLRDAYKLSMILGAYRIEPDRTIESLRNFIRIKDSIHNQEKVKVQNELLIEYGTKETEKELEYEKLEKANKTMQRNISIGMLIALLFVLAVLTLYYRQKKKHASDLEKKVEEKTADLKASNKALEESNNELERYAYIASHDLKEPLRNIMSFVNLIKRKELVKDKDAIVYFDFVEKGTAQMNNIVEGLLEFSELRTKEVNIDKVKISEVYSSVKESILKQFSTKNINIRTIDFPQEIQSNRDSLFIIFKNLIENGIKYNESFEAKVNITYKEVDHFHQFKFQDNGIGIQEDYFDEIFSSFRRLHNQSKYDGSGIGLAMCKRLIEHLGGTITVESKISEGSTFTINLPV